MLAGASFKVVAIGCTTIAIVTIGRCKHNIFTFANIGIITICCIAIVIIASWRWYGRMATSTSEHIITVCRIAIVIITRQGRYRYACHTSTNSTVPSFYAIAANAVITIPWVGASELTRPIIASSQWVIIIRRWVGAT
jgi:hypothetical protein